MKTQTAFTDTATLEKELAGLAPLVRQAFLQAGGPAPEVEAAIREEARRFAGVRRARFGWPLFRVLAAAACLVLVLGGALQLHLIRQTSGRPAETVSRRTEKSAAPSSTGKTDDTSGFAKLLLDIQGLDAESYFTAEASEALWL